MARQAAIQYVQFYTVGNAARKLEVKQPVAPKRMPKVKKQTNTVIRIDPVAILGIFTAVLMLTLMVVGFFGLNSAQQENAIMQQQVSSLQAENKTLQNVYQSSYDIDEVERTALALGFVPKDQVEQIPIEVAVTQPVEENTDLWTEISAFLTGLFA